MSETITVDMPRMSIGNDLTEALAAHGLQAELVETDGACALRVRFADDEHERLLGAATHAIEAYLSDQSLPLVVQRADGGAVVRPPGD
jgi:hypothetical protein